MKSLTHSFNIAPEKNASLFCALRKMCPIDPVSPALGDTSAAGIIDSFIFSSPSKIVRCFCSMVKDKSIFHHIGITLYETIVSFLLVIIVSLLTAILLWFSKKLSEILDPYLVVLNSLPKSALAPLLIVWLGATQTTIIVAGMSVAIFGKHP